jgi:hypothetical protein
LTYHPKISHSKQETLEAAQSHLSKVADGKEQYADEDFIAGAIWQQATQKKK